MKALRTKAKLISGLVTISTVFVLALLMLTSPAGAQRK
jgi:hypothetical protein